MIDFRPAGATTACPCVGAGSIRPAADPVVNAANRGIELDRTPPTVACIGARGASRGNADHELPPVRAGHVAIQSKGESDVGTVVADFHAQDVECTVTSGDTRIDISSGIKNGCRLRISSCCAQYYGQSNKTFK